MANRKTEAASRRSFQRSVRELARLAARARTAKCRAALADAEADERRIEQEITALESAT